jgi:hypothetical protein
MDDKPSATPAEALYYFMAYLTSRKQESGPFSAHHDAALAAELVDFFCQTQGWGDGSAGGVRSCYPSNLRPFPLEGQFAEYLKNRHHALFDLAEKSFKQGE